MNQKKVYLIGIGGIGVSALARYYISQNWEVLGSDKNDSQIISELQKQGANIIIGSNAERITSEIDLVIYTEAIPPTNEELLKSQALGIETLKYNQALGNIVNKHKLIAITGTHGKSTTTSMISQIFKNSQEDFSSIVGTLLKEFDGKNFYKRGGDDGYFIIEACEYKEHFLEYKPALAVITNIEYDHADYFKTPEDYIAAYEKFINNIIPGGFCILDKNDTHSASLLDKRDDIHYVEVDSENFQLGDEVIYFPEIMMQVPGEHVLFDAKLAYVVAHMAGISDDIIIETLESYSGVWRRMEKIGLTRNKNLLMSDYAHHPTEVETTLRGIKSSSQFQDKKLFVIFQPHQYSRTIELLEGFKSCFQNADKIIIPNIYESRDSEEDKAKMSTDIFVSSIDHPNIQNGEGLENTLKLIEEYDSENPDSSIILLLGAGNIDTLRGRIM